MRVVIDARMGDGSGGVQQWVIGLADALSRLDDGDEEYQFLVAEGDGAWLAPYVHGRATVLVERAADTVPTPPEVSPDPAAKAVATASRRATKARRRGFVGRARRRFRRLFRRAMRRRKRPPRPRAPRPRPGPPPSPFDLQMQRARADVVHFTRPSASRTALPNIYQPWDLQHVHLPEFFSVETRANREAVYRAFCAQASRIVVASRWVKDDLHAEYGIAPDRIAVVNPAPVTEAYERPTTEEEDAIAARLALPPRFAFYPAQTWSHKNHERLFEALRRLRDRGVEIPLVCSGRQSERMAVLAQRRTELGLDDLVTFLGFLSPAEIQVVYGRATMLVFPSLYEGWGLPIIEAFAAGVPVACSNVTSLPALVGDAALVFDPTDPGEIAAAMERLWLDADLCARLAAAGRDRIRMFDWGRTALTMRAHYREVAGRRLDATDRELLAAQPAV